MIMDQETGRTGPEAGVAVSSKVPTPSNPFEPGRLHLLNLRLYSPK